MPCGIPVSTLADNVHTTLLLLAVQTLANVCSASNNESPLLPRTDPSDLMKKGDL